MNSEHISQRNSHSNGLLRAVVLQVWSPDQQRQCSGTCHTQTFEVGLEQHTSTCSVSEYIGDAGDAVILMQYISQEQLSREVILVNTEIQVVVWQ